MVIKTLEATYTVQSQLPYAEDNRVYVCEKDGSEELFLLVEITDKEKIRSAMDFLMAAKRMPEFSDFIDCFFAEEFFYAVFAYESSRPLADILKEDNPALPERLTMMRELLEKWMLLKLPPYFAYDTVGADRVRYTPATKSVLGFALAKLEQRDEVTFVKVQQRLATLWEVLFAEEFAKESVPELVRFENSLLLGTYEDIPALFVAYDKLEEEILKQPEGEWAATKTWPFRLWEKIKKIFPTVKRIGEIILLVGAFFILILSFRHSMSSGGQKRQFEQIGTLEIRKESQPEKAEEEGFHPWQGLQDLLSE